MKFLREGIAEREERERERDNNRDLKEDKDRSEKQDVVSRLKKDGNRVFKQERRAEKGRRVEFLREKEIGKRDCDARIQGGNDGQKGTRMASFPENAFMVGWLCSNIRLEISTMNRFLVQSLVVATGAWNTFHKDDGLRRASGCIGDFSVLWQRCGEALMIAFSLMGRRGWVCPLHFSSRIVLRNGLAPKGIAVIEKNMGYCLVHGRNKYLAGFWVLVR